MFSVEIPKNGLTVKVPSLSETSAFAAVLEQKSFAKAAKQLGLSPARTSELVRKLEERLGVRLIERTTRSVAPTVAGEDLLKRLRPVLDDYRAAIESTSDYRDNPAGRLRLAVATPAAELVLAPAVGPFLALYPEISLEISVSNEPTDIVAGRFDAGVQPGERVAADMIAVRISGEMPRVVVASPAYLAKRGVPRTPEELAAHSCIRFRLHSGVLLPWYFCRRRRVFDIHVEGRLIVNGTGIALEAAAGGLGLIQIHPAYVAEELEAGRLVKVLEDWAPPPIGGFFLYYPSRRHVRPALKALADFLRKPPSGPSRSRTALQAAETSSKAASGPASSM